MFAESKKTIKETQETDRRRQQLQNLQKKKIDALSKTNDTKRNRKHFWSGEKRQEAKKGKLPPHPSERNITVFARKQENKLEKSQCSTFKRGTSSTCERAGAPECPGWPRSTICFNLTCKSPWFGAVIQNYIVLQLHPQNWGISFKNVSKYFSWQLTKWDIWANWEKRTGWQGESFLSH